MWPFEANKCSKRHPIARIGFAAKREAEAAGKDKEDKEEKKEEEQEEEEVEEGEKVE